MNIYDLKVGDLYDTIQDRRKTIELFNKPHSRWDRTDLESTYGSLLLSNDYFVVLETKVIHNSHYCLKLLTTSGIVGWTSELQFDEYYNPYHFKQVTQP